MQLFSSLRSETLKDVVEAVRDIIGKRAEDVKDFDNLQHIFMRGRKVGKVPSSSSDVAATDRIGDFNYSASYLYLAVEDSGLKWRRIALSTW